jgi:hypothetical protein
MAEYKLKTNKPFKVLLFGRTGVGKTASIATLLETGQKVRLISADPNAEAGIQAGIELHKVKMEEDQLGIQTPARPVLNFANMLEGLELELKTAPEALCKVADKHRKDCRGFINIVSSTNNFVGDITGKAFGKVMEWGTDTTLVVDSLTTVCDEIRLHVSGNKSSTQGEWGQMQARLKWFMSILIKDARCNVVLLGHPTKEIDPVSGAITIYPMNLGQALNEWFPSNFTDVIYATKDGKEYVWSTQHRTAVCSGRNLAIAEKLKPDFKQLFIKTT